MKALRASAKRNKKLYSFDRPNWHLLECFSPLIRPKLAVTLICTEVTSLCPVTGQPDFANVEIIYKPVKRCLESKSVKLYLMGFRQCGMFAEQMAQRICQDVQTVTGTSEVFVTVIFASRGGIEIHATASPTPS